MKREGSKELMRSVRPNRERESSSRRVYNVVIK